MRVSTLANLLNWDRDSTNKYLYPLVCAARASVIVLHTRNHGGGDTSLRVMKFFPEAIACCNRFGAMSIVICFVGARTRLVDEGHMTFTRERFGKESSRDPAGFSRLTTWHHLTTMTPPPLLSNRYLMLHSTNKRKRPIGTSEPIHSLLSSITATPMTPYYSYFKSKQTRSVKLGSLIRRRSTSSIL